MKLDLSLVYIRYILMRSERTKLERTALIVFSLNSKINVFSCWMLILIQSGILLSRNKIIMNIE